MRVKVYKRESDVPEKTVIVRRGKTIAVNRQLFLWRIRERERKKAEEVLAKARAVEVNIRNLFAPKK